MFSPVYLFSDSQLLFWSEDAGPYIRRIRGDVGHDRPIAVYIGASNGDQPEYYDIFEQAMGRIGVEKTHMITAGFSEVECDWLTVADIICLAGGDAARGWETIVRTGMKELILERFSDGAVLIGVSAGAAHLGRIGWTEAPSGEVETFSALGVVPFAVGSHDEKAGWTALRRVVSQSKGAETGIGIPSGGGCVYNTDGSLSPIRHGVTEIIRKDGRFIDNLLLPETGSGD